MGYLQDSQTTIYIPPTCAHRVTGTWSHAAGQVVDTICQSVNDANQTSKLTIPLMIFSNSNSQKGCKLKSVEIDYEITGAALEEVTAVINKVTRGADTAVAVVTTPAFTYDTGHDTANERLAKDQHKMTLTITTPFWVDNDEYVLVELTINQAGDTGVFELLGAFANVTLRL